MMRGGGVDVTTNRRTRDEGSDEEGEDGKGDGNAMVLAVVIDSASVTAYQWSGGSCRVAAAAVGAWWQCNRGMVVAAVGVTAAW